MLQSYTQLLTNNIDSIVFILGAGTSLHGLDISRIHSHPVISVNSSILLMPWETGLEEDRYFISDDSAIRTWTYWKDVKQSKCHKIIRNSWEKYYDEIPDFYYFWPRKKPDTTIDPDDTGLCYYNSMATSIDFALKILGCKKIFLLGLDHYDVGGKTHFWQFWPKEKQPKGMFAPILLQYKMFLGSEKTYDALDKFAEYKDAKIFNCNPKSRVETFEKIDLKNV